MHTNCQCLWDTDKGVWCGNTFCIGLYCWWLPFLNIKSFALNPYNRQVQHCLAGNSTQKVSTVKDDRTEWVIALDSHCKDYHPVTLSLVWSYHDSHKSGLHASKISTIWCFRGSVHNQLCKVWPTSWKTKNVKALSKRYSIQHKQLKQMLGLIYVQGWDGI